MESDSGIPQVSRQATQTRVAIVGGRLAFAAVSHRRRLPNSVGKGGLARLTRRARRNNIVITMRPVHVSIRQIGNSQGVVIPKPVLAQLGLDSKVGAEMTIEDGALVLRRPASPTRTGWAEAAARIAEAGNDELVMGDFGNAEDSELVW
jgi:antitoxin MazE